MSGVAPGSRLLHPPSSLNRVEAKRSLCASQWQKRLPSSAWVENMSHWTKCKMRLLLSTIQRDEVRCCRFCIASGTNVRGPGSGNSLAYASRLAGEPGSIWVIPHDRSAGCKPAKRAPRQIADKLCRFSSANERRTKPDRHQIIARKVRPRRPGADPI